MLLQIIQVLLLSSLKHLEGWSSIAAIGQGRELMVWQWSEALTRTLLQITGMKSGYSISSVQFSRSVVSNSLWPHESQHARPPCPSPTPKVYPNSCPRSRWCHPAISSSVVPFSSWPQSFPASESFPMSQLFAWVGQSTGVSASASVLPKNTQDWSPLGGLVGSPCSPRDSSIVLSNTTVQKHQFFGAQLSSQYKSQLFKNTGKFPKSDRIQKIAYS